MNIRIFNSASCGAMFPNCKSSIISPTFSVVQCLGRLDETAPYRLEAAGNDAPILNEIFP